MSKEDIKRHLWSFVNTFVPTFLVALGTQLQDLDLQTLTGSVVIAILIAAARAGWKVVVEKFTGRI